MTRGRASAGGRARPLGGGASRAGRPYGASGSAGIGPAGIGPAGEVWRCPPPGTF